MVAEGALVLVQTGKKGSVRARIQRRFAAPVAPQLGALAVLCAGCSLLIDVGADQCEEDADCSASGLPGSCVLGVCSTTNAMIACEGADCPTNPPICNGVVCSAPPDPVCFNDQCASERLVRPFVCAPVTPASEEEIPLQVRVEEYTMPEQPLRDITVTACEQTDVLCATPVARASRSDSMGTMDLTLPRGFFGYVEVKTATTVPYIWQFTKPYVAPIPPRLVRVAAFTTIEALAQVSNIDFDDTKGIVLAEAFDCAGVPQGGIHLEEGSGAALPFYLVNLLPNLETEVTVLDELNGLALGGFFHVIPGFAAVTVRIGTGGPVLLTFNTIVRAGAMTYMDVRQ